MSVTIDILNDAIGELLEQLCGQIDVSREFIEKFVEFRAVVPNIDSDQLLKLLQEETLDT